MLHKSCSINEVIARIIRNTRVYDSSYVIDFKEWIPEAMGKMKTKFDLSPRFEDVNIVFHKGRLPCDLDHISAVEYNGTRLGTTDSVKHYKTGHNLGDVNNSANDIPLFKSIIEVAPNQAYYDENNLMYVSDIQPLVDKLATPEDCDQHPSDWYKIEMDYILTSFADGDVRIHYMAMPTDDEGLPLIPDNEDYKQAIYYYTRAMMVGAGYDDKVFKYDELMQRFEVHARRAINQITYPSPDQREQQIKTQVRFIPPANYWENFFRVDSPEQPYY